MRRRATCAAQEFTGFAREQRLELQEVPIPNLLRSLRDL
jgi:hypothetical protein